MIEIINNIEIHTQTPRLSRNCILSMYKLEKGLKLSIIPEIKNKKWTTFVKIFMFSLRNPKNKPKIYKPFHLILNNFYCPKQNKNTYFRISAKQFQGQLITNMYSHQNTVSEFLHLPQQAFLFRPHHSGSPAQRDDFKIGEGKRIRRLIFEGWAEDTYTPYQLEQLQRFDEFLKGKGVKLDSRWNRSWRLRYLLSTGCDHEKCLEDMGRFLSGYISRVRELQVSRNVLRLLGEGAFYIMGRDCHYRPILVFDAEKLVRLKPSEEELEEMQIYFLEYVIRNYLIPGQVENWVALVDSGRQGLFSFVDAMKKAFSFLADNYRSRLFACYNVRITTSISMIWSIVKRFLDQDTVEKINLFDQDVPEPLFTYTHPSQIEQKFGGTMPNIPAGCYWPPREWSKTYRYEKCPVDLMSKEEYTRYYREGRLRDTKIHQDSLVLPPVNIELRENPHLPRLKRMEREFQSHLEGHREDYLVFQKDIEPYSKITTISYSTVINKMSMRPPQK